MVAILLQKLQFILKIQYITIVIRDTEYVKVRSTSTTLYSAYLFVFGATAHSGPGPPHLRGF